eukprot:10821886-Alexandrium_andersonii.AAC.1
MPGLSPGGLSGRPPDIAREGKETTQGAETEQWRVPPLHYRQGTEVRVCEPLRLISLSQRIGGHDDA